MIEDQIPYIPLMMAHCDLSSTPDIPLPQGYSLSLFRPGDEEHWGAIAASAGEFDTEYMALAYFRDHFKANYDQLNDRCLFLLDESGKPSGTATGWFMDDDPSIGRLHWVAIDREHQGKGLCKPLVSASMRLMLRHGHDKALLTTQPGSWKGIKVYLDLGWKPYDDDSAEYLKGWAIVKDKTGHKDLMYF